MEGLVDLGIWRDRLVLSGRPSEVNIGQLNAIRKEGFRSLHFAFIYLKLDSRRNGRLRRSASHHPPTRHNVPTVPKRTDAMGGRLFILHAVGCGLVSCPATTPAGWSTHCLSRYASRCPRSKGQHRANQFELHTILRTLTLQLGSPWCETGAAHQE